MKEQLRTGLLGFIAVLMLVNTYMLATMESGGSSNNGSYVPGSQSSAAAAPMNNTPGTATSVQPNQPVTFDPASAANNSPSTPSAPLTSVKFREYDHDFGTIKQNTENTKIFSFTNTGDKPLIIENAKGSCGCTVPKYPKDPIAPGGTGEIEVVYKPGTQKNQQTKSVTITANTEPASTILKISAFVEEG